MLDSPVDLTNYQCPRTRTPLRLEGERILNAGGETIGHVRDGYVCFESASAAEDERTRAELKTLNRMAIETGWQAALEAVYDKGLVDYATNPGRAKFLDLLPMDGHSDVLEIGPGLGQFTSLIARKARTVSALEVVPGQAAFASKRTRLEGCANVRFAAGGGDCRLPYVDQCFDLVILNLVLEWCGSRASDSHLEAQLRLLDEIHRVLRPGGHLYVATKNRYAIKYVIGKPDEHFDGMRFGSALPRWLSRTLFRKRPSGMLHSYRALKLMLHKTGFRDLQSWWAAADFRFPTDFVRSDAASVRDARRNPDFVNGSSRSEDLLMRLMPAGLVKHLTPGLNFLARKSSS